jgi:segregation and condensation protein B
MTDTDFRQTGKNKNLPLLAQVEALLFVAPEPVSPYQLSTILDETQRAVQTCLEELEEQYRERGIRLQWHDGKVQLTSAPESAEIIELFLNLEATTTLSRAALETMAIIAYQQPVTRPQIDTIRGVNSDGVIRGLLSKGLIDDVGRAEGPGRPILYGTTSDFLKYFGLSSLGDLPPLNLENIQRENEHPGDQKILKE